MPVSDLFSSKSKESMDLFKDNVQEHEDNFNSYLIAYNEKLKEIYKDYFNCDVFLLPVTSTMSKEIAED